MTADESHTTASVSPAARSGSLASLGPGADEPLVEEDEDGVYYATHDMSRDGLCTSIALALAEVTDVDPTDLISNFSRYADPDGLNRLFRHRPDGEPRVGGSIRLAIDGHLVRVDSRGHIEIDPDGVEG